MGKGGSPDIGTVRIQGDIDDFGNVMGDGCEQTEITLDWPEALLELQVRDQSREIGISSALAVSVDATLDLGHPCLDGGDGGSDGSAHIIVIMDTEGNVGKRSLNLGNDVIGRRRQCAAVRVAQDETLRTCFMSHPEHIESEPRIGLVSVEEMLGVEEDPTSVSLEELDRLAHHSHTLI